MIGISINFIPLSVFYNIFFYIRIYWCPLFIELSHKKHQYSIILKRSSLLLFESLYMHRNSVNCLKLNVNHKICYIQMYIVCDPHWHQHSATEWTVLMFYSWSVFGSFQSSVVDCNKRNRVFKWLANHLKYN